MANIIVRGEGGELRLFARYAAENEAILLPVFGTVFETQNNYTGVDEHLARKIRERLWISLDDMSQAKHLPNAGNEANCELCTIENDEHKELFPWSVYLRTKREIERGEMLTIDYFPIERPVTPELPLAQPMDEENFFPEQSPDLFLMDVSQPTQIAEHQIASREPRILPPEEDTDDDEATQPLSPRVIPQPLPITVDLTSSSSEDSQSIRRRLFQDDDEDTSAMLLPKTDGKKSFYWNSQVPMFTYYPTSTKMELKDGVEYRLLIVEGIEVNTDIFVPEYFKFRIPFYTAILRSFLLSWYNENKNSKNSSILLNSSNGMVMRVLSEIGLKSFNYDQECYYGTTTEQLESLLSKTNSQAFTFDEIKKSIPTL